MVARNAEPFVDLERSWHAQLDEFLISPHFSHLVHALIAVVFSLICVMHASLPRAETPHYTHRVAFDYDNLARRTAVDDAMHIHEFPPIKLQQFPVPANSTTRLRYAKLAKLYLTPFRNGIRREDFMMPFMRQDICGGCFLVQVKNKTLFVHDPRGVRALMAEFRELRMREALYWIRNAVTRGIFDNAELVLSTTDGVVSTSKSHHYRMPPPEHPIPVFTVARCNVSDNIPFPMVLVDVLRRGLGKKYWRSKALLKKWDQTAETMGQVDGRDVPWGEKMSKAVFRGSLRVPAILKDAKDLDRVCERVGRSGLWHMAKYHEKLLQEYDYAQGRRRRLWPLPSSWFTTKTEALMDVKVSGVCGEKIYVSDRLPMKEQNFYKYVVHAEGNSFWADRLLLQLFGSSVVMKQMTPCGMFFEPLLEPYTHFVPIDFQFEQLALQTLWAKRNDAKVRGIVRKAREFAGEYLSVAGVQTFVDELLTQYADLLQERDIQIETGAVQLYP